jgi:hypothetical protein
MSGFFGYKLSEVAVLVILLVAVIPVAKSAAAFNFLPIVSGLLTYLTLSTVRRVSLGLRILISVLIAMIFVPRRFRGKRVWENFEDPGTSLLPPTETPEVVEQMKNTQGAEVRQRKVRQRKGLKKKWKRRRRLRQWKMNQSPLLLT